ncbi:uncharacterized protein EDB93DRAFT_1054897, partial [Suillus bovinus]|uniref:uncharacterized protein n=1 Tax=Suillus bovinus TaxID=48563 RepID=UPI001B872BBF
IRGKSKGNVISIGTIMLQVVMQFIFRAIHYLGITELEMAKLAFAVLSFLTYPMWCDKKPLN